jgi:hypothetical protein
MARTMHQAVRDFLNSKGLYRTDGRPGVITLAMLVSALGYKDPQCFGQLTREASIGDLIEFLEDNSGAIEAIIGWISRQQHTPEWIAELEKELPPQEGDWSDYRERM